MLKQANRQQKPAVTAAVTQTQRQVDEARRAEARKAKARQLVMPTEAEDAAITAAALDDPDNRPLTDEQLALFQPARRKRGRPTKDATKVLVSIRFDATVLDAFKATGEGWQTRMNAVLKDYLERHQIGTDVR